MLREGVTWVRDDWCCCCCRYCHTCSSNFPNVARSSRFSSVKRLTKLVSSELCFRIFSFKAGTDLPTFSCTKEDKLCGSWAQAIQKTRNKQNTATKPIQIYRGRAKEQKFFLLSNQTQWKMVSMQCNDLKVNVHRQWATISHENRRHCHTSRRETTFDDNGISFHPTWLRRPCKASVSWINSSSAAAMFCTSPWWSCVALLFLLMASWCFSSNKCNLCRIDSTGPPGKTQDK